MRKATEADQIIVKEVNGMKVHPRQICRKRTAGFKRMLCVVLAMLLMAPCLSAFQAAAAGNQLDDFYVTAIADHASTEIHWWRQPLQQTYYLFLPADVDRGALQVGFTGGAEPITIGTTEVHNGEVTDALAEGSSFLIRSGARIYSLSVLQSASLPSVYIATESGSLANVHADKSYKEPAKITVVENGEVTLEDVQLSYIKGRGNSSWVQDKKPYNIKFEKKTDLFGMGKAKKWSMLASVDDDALVRNPAAFYIAERLGLDFISKYQFTDLYVNGEYLGNYLICESVEVGSTRVDIADLEDANEEANPDVDIEACPTANTGAGADRGSRKWVEIPNDPDDISGGYLLEFDYQDRYDAEVSGFVSTKGQPVVLKSPEYATKAEVEYISGLFNAAEEALYSADGYSSEGKHYSEYFDMESFFAQYLLNEFCNDVDASSSSFFLYKSTEDDKLHFSPVWDFDRALGNGYRRDVDTANPTIWWANSMGDFGPGIRSINAVAFARPEFRQAAAEAWNASFLSSQSDEMLSFLRALAEQLRPSAVMDRVLWKNTVAAAAGTDFDYRVNRVLRFVEKRVETLNAAFSEPVAMLYYDENGGKGTVFNHQIAHVGDVVRITEGGRAVEVSPPSDDYLFAGWNTEPDGSGKTYRANQYIRLTSETTVLYAVWEPLPQGGLGQIKAFLYQIYRLLLELQDWIEYTFKFPVQ